MLGGHTARPEAFGYAARERTQPKGSVTVYGVPLGSIKRA